MLIGGGSKESGKDLFIIRKCKDRQFSPLMAVLRLDVITGSVCSIEWC